MTKHYFTAPYYRPDEAPIHSVYRHCTIQKIPANDDCDPYKWIAQAPMGWMFDRRNTTSVPGGPTCNAASNWQRQAKHDDARRISRGN